MNHSKSPWFRLYSREICDANYVSVATVHGSTVNEHEANAYLIASAPDLLDALKQIALAQDMFTVSEIAEKAIAKAERGES